MQIDEIYKMIIDNPYSARGYYKLGNALCGKNDKQAFLCYENALFFCDDELRDEILLRRNKLIECGVSVPKTAFVILSYNTKQLTEDCINSIRENVYENCREIILIDNDSRDGSADYLSEQPDIILQLNKENVGFPKGCNQGIELAEKDSDILLINSDTVVMPNAIFWLRMGLYERETIGIAGCMTNSFNWFFGQNIGENEKDIEYYKEFAGTINIPMHNAIQNKVCVGGFCMLIKRKAMDKVGLLDEIFSPGNYEDNDICLRMRGHGYEVVLIHNSYIVHLYHQSFKKTGNLIATSNRNAKIIEQKYKCNTINTVVHKRENWDAFINEQLAGKNVLEVNCGLGENLFYWKYKYPQVNFSGVDREPATFLYRKSTNDVDLYNYSDIEYWPFGEKKYDLIYLDTQSIKKEEMDKYVRAMTDNLDEGGTIVFRVENDYHYSVWIDRLVLGHIDKNGDDVFVTKDEVLSSLEKNDLAAKKWIFSFTSVDDLEEEKKKIFEALPEDRKRDASVKSYLIFASKK